MPLVRMTGRKEKSVLTDLSEFNLVNYEKYLPMPCKFKLELINALGAHFGHEFDKHLLVTCFMGTSSIRESDMTPN